ncbi:hypothetical protein [Halorussus caseinilyticus]|uniref:Small CPxCG-related zinc finger protein n=1 Tax=Halorussus caseinilyticus TaxID=3034025 RepID=A0ABD5WIR9_9EURY|nr:hypothetical protein [Halorussus sp. DT72]
MRRQTPPPAVRTRISCDRTDGFNVEDGLHHYDWCPFCGNRADAEDHKFVVTVSE